MDMSEDMFRRVVEVSKKLQERNGREEQINLAGIGESTMHPELPKFMAIVRREMPWLQICFATNGLTMTEELAKEIKQYRPIIWVSLHRPEIAAKAVNLLKREGMFAGASVDPSMSSVNWAGQVDWPVTAPPGPCAWTQLGQVIVLADGRATRCPFDGEAIGVVADTPEGLLDAEHGAFSLCKSCHMTP